VHQILFRPEVSLRRLDGLVPQKHLDLLQLPAGSPAQLRARAATVMGRDSGHAGSDGIGPDKLPNHLLRKGSFADHASANDGPEHWAIANPGSGRPRIDRHLDPGRHGDSPHPAMLPDQIHNAPPAIPLLDVLERERRDLRPPQSASQEHGKDGSVP
jgi:hypothetical protein